MTVYVSADDSGIGLIDAKTFTSEGFRTSVQ